MKIVQLIICAFASCLLSNMVEASGLQVSPVMLSLQARQNAEGLWLSNTGDQVLHAQVRVYHWTQEGGEEQLTPSRGLLVSPPMLEIAAGSRQLVRVIRVGAPPSGTAAVEDAYRISVDELPVDTQGGKGLNFVLHYSLPVFVEPAGKGSTAPELHWSLRREDGHAVLVVSNSGDGHAQLSQLSFTDSQGGKVIVSDGLLGYVLPGAQMHWALKSPADAFVGGGTLHARINGEAVTQPISLASAAH